MSNFETQHMYKVEKEEEGVVFAVCIRHRKNPEYLVGVRKIENNEYVETVYSGTDKTYAEKLYSKLVSERKS